MANKLINKLVNYIGQYIYLFANKHILRSIHRK